MSRSRYDAKKKVHGMKCRREEEIETTNVKGKEVTTLLTPRGRGVKR